MGNFIKELGEMNLEQVLARKSELEKEIREAQSVDALEGMDEKIKAVNERIAELQDLEKRKNDALAIQTGSASAEVIEERNGGMKEMTEKEQRAAEFVQSGKMETRALLSTGRIAKPTKVDGVNGLAEVASDIVDDVNAIPLNGTGAWTVAYKKTDAIAASVTEGSAIGGTGSTYDYVTINPAQWGVLDQISNQVKKMSPLDYQSAIEESALIALRAEASDKIVAAIKASSLTEKKTQVALDADYLKNIVLGFRAVKNKGNVFLYLAQADLLVLGKVRGTNEKKALFDIEFDAGSTTSGTIKEGGMAVRFRVLDQLTAGEQLFGQPLAIDMPMWDNYEIKTDEGGQYFAANQICIRGQQTAGADLVVYHGMQHITQT